MIKRILGFCAAILVLCLAVIPYSFAGDLKKTEVWFAPLQHESSEEYFNLFSNVSSWGNSLRKTDVFMIMPDDINDGFLEKLKDNGAFSMLSDNGVDIALQRFIAEPGNADITLSCESTKKAQETVEMIRRIRGYGGNVKYINMIEPLYEMRVRPRIADNMITFGKQGDRGIVGDWNNDGTDTIGVYRPSTRTFFLSNSNTNPNVDTNLAFGIDGDMPVVGDWNNDGTDTIGVYRPSTRTFNLLGSFNIGNICNYSPERVAEETSKFARIINSYDGNIVVGSVEALPFASSIEDLERWIVASEGYGIEVPYLYVDFNILGARVTYGWSDEEIKSYLRDLKDMLNEHNVEIATVLNAEWSFDGDSNYYDNTLEWTGLIKEAIGVPAKASVETWGKNNDALWPGRILPDTERNSLTNVVIDSVNKINEGICGNDVCEAGEGLSCIKDCGNVECDASNAGLDDGGTCRAECGADYVCDGKRAMSTLAYCGAAGNTAVLDRCSLRCIAEDKSDNLCRRNGISDCTGDFRCNGKMKGTNNCDDICVYNEVECDGFFCELKQLIKRIFG